MSMSRWFVVAAVFAAGCPSSSTKSAPPPAAPAPAAVEKARAPEGEPEAIELARETELQSPSGVAFTAPSGWFVVRGKEVLELRPPERDMSLWLVDLAGKGAEEAIAIAWSKVKPDFALEPDDVVTPPAREGWDEIVQVTYKVPVEQMRMVVGAARRKGEMTYVVLIDAPVAALQRRGAQLAQILGSQQHTGLDEESFAEAEAVPLDETRAAAFDAFIEKARTTLKVPGAAVAVVQGGKVVFERGYGVRDPKGRKVTPETRFMIGSTTKALTSLMAAILVDQGKFEWSTPVAKLLPSFALADPEIAGKVEMQHAFCACTGMPRQDLEFAFEYANSTPDGAWVEPLLGVYGNDALGELTVKREGDHVVIDVGEWKGRAGALESAGSKVLLLVGAPIAGLPFLPQEDGSLLLDVGQQQYVFRRTDIGK